MNFLKLMNKKMINSEAGMSLMEILAVISLIAIVGGFIISNISQRLDEGKAESSKIQLRNIMGVLDEFRRHCNRYPTSEEGLQALVTQPTGGRECKKYRQGGYFQNGNIPQDSFDCPYSYSSPDNGRTFIVKSLGQDCAEGGTGSDADISSADL
ncbi:MAG: type II secretion system major pseudopilin GspG [Bacteriovoracaceae bacterium]|nr:type II secretion system major pseudopilin GspG [Bacteriovoracaceae bacterium]